MLCDASDCEIFLLVHLVQLVFYALMILATPAAGLIRHSHTRSTLTPKNSLQNPYEDFLVLTLTQLSVTINLFIGQSKSQVLGVK